MPRAKTVVIGKVTPEQAHDHAIARAIKLHSPYSLVPTKTFTQEDEGYYVIYTAPKGGKRKTIATIRKRSNAIKLRDRLSEAWAEGFWSNG